MVVRSRMVAAVAAGVVAAGLTGCGTSESSADGSSVTSTTAASGLDLRGLAVGDTVKAGVVSSAASRAVQDAGAVRVSMSGGAVPDGLTGVADFSTSPASLSFGGTVMGQDITVLLVDGLLYLKSPALGAKPWIKIDPKGDSATSQQVGSMLEPLTHQTDPTWMMATNTDADLSVTAVTDTGVTVEQDFTAEQVAKVAKDLYGNTASGSTAGALTVTTTLDGSARPTKVVVSSKAGDQTITYSDWGADLTITAPPAGKVGTLDDVPDFSQP